MSDIYALLERDHQNLKSLLHELSSRDDDHLHTLSLELKAHTEAEETTFYAPLAIDAKAAGAVLQAEKEHKELRMLALDLPSASDDDFLATARSLGDVLLSHVEQEEGPLFARAREILSDEQAQAIGVEYERQKQLVKGRMHSRAY